MILPSARARDSKYARVSRTVPNSMKCIYSRWMTYKFSQSITYIKMDFKTPHPLKRRGVNKMNENVLDVLTMGMKCMTLCHIISISLSMYYTIIIIWHYYSVIVSLLYCHWHVDIGLLLYCITYRVNQCYPLLAYLSVCNVLYYGEI